VAGEVMMAVFSASDDGFVLQMVKPNYADQLQQSAS
jgi:hypothetical protein